MSKYNLNISQTGQHATSVVGDHAQLVANFNTESSLEEFVTLLHTIQQELKQIALPSDAKDEALQQVDRAITAAKSDESDTSTIREYLEKTADIVKNSSTIALGVTKFWPLLRKALEWAT